LTKSAAEIFNDKVSLIYEYNKNTPLFIRKADEEIKKKHAENAVEILTAGLKLYPNYAAAHILLGRAYSLLGDLNQALKSIKTGSVLINSTETYNYYLKEIDSARKPGSLFDFTTRTSYFSSQIDSTQSGAFPEEKKDENYNLEPEKDIQPLDVDDRLGEIARDISNVRINHSTSNQNYELTNPDTFVEDNMFVSETLAKIYITQGEMKEAIGVYQKLIKKNPAKQEYYLQKISELQSQLE
jgi:tetratricopeptide (TPR) repeat protein